MIRLDISNFRNIREAHLHDDKPFSLIVGYNESGKSGLVGSLQFVLTGSAFGLRGEGISDLITTGEERMHVRLQMGPLNINRTAGSGDALKGIAERLQVPVEVMPLLFDSQLCGDGGNKAMRAFLDGVASSKFDALSHFAADPIVSECINAARRSGKITTKQIIAYCESLRAMQKEPALPVMPSVPNPSAEEVAKAQAAADSANQVLVDAVSTHAESEKIGRQLLQITSYLQAMENYEKLKAASTLNDTLGHTRAKLEKLAGVNVNSLKAVQQILEDLPALNPVISEASSTFNNAHNTVIRASTWAREYLDANPPPKSAPVLPTLHPDAQATYDDLKASNMLDAESLRTMCLSSKGDSDGTLTAKQNAEKTVQLVRGIRDNLLQQQGAWKAYATALPEYESAKAKSQSDWKMWDDASKLIAAAEIEHINKAGDVFGTMVSEFSSYVLQARKVIINRDTGISLGNMPIDRCSVSTRWRIEVSVMAAIARMLKSPLLVIDAADVLDERNKATMQDFLLERIVPHFQHVVVTATCRGRIEDEKPAMDARVTKWIMSNGQLSRAASSATG